MKYIISLILLIVINATAEEQIFKTFAICTYVNGLEYCAVSNANVESDFNSVNHTYSLKSTNNDIYTYDIDTSSISVIKPLDNIEIEVFDAIENINGNTGKPYVVMKSEHLFVLVDNLTNCYIKKYYTETPNLFYQAFNFITVDVADYFGFYNQCISNLKEND